MNQDDEPVDVWNVHDPTACPTCGKIDCEEHAPPEKRSSKGNGQDASYIPRLADVLELERARREAKRILDLEDRGPISEPAIETLRERLSRPRAKRSGALTGGNHATVASSWRRNSKRARRRLSAHSSAHWSMATRGSGAMW
jgi:hypothetical protein